MACEVDFFDVNCGPETFSRSKTPISPDLHRWADVIAPFIDVAVTDDDTRRVFRDFGRKLELFKDPVRGYGVLNGLLFAGDDVDLCCQFLELGVSWEFSFVDIGDGPLDPAYPEQLDGGTAVHLAAFLGRERCLQALIDSGGDLWVETSQGKAPGDVAKDENIEKIITAAKDTGDKSLAMLAHEKKYFAIRFMMRSGLAQEHHFGRTFEGLTAVDWIREAVAAGGEDASTASKVLDEIKYRFPELDAWCDISSESDEMSYSYGVLSESSEILDKELPEPGKILDKELLEPSEISDQELPEPGKISDHKLLEPDEISDQELAESSEILDQELVEPSNISDQELAEPSKILDQELAELSKILDQELAEPSKISDQESAEPGEASSWSLKSIWLACRLS